MTLEQIRQEAERRAILSTLKKNKGNKKETAKALGISRQMLHKKINMLHIT
jgi:DNA-binding NtrC family response regulator